MIDFDFSTESKPQKGCLLISEPFLADKSFSRSVIYLCDHDENGSWGFVLNNPLNNVFSDFFPDEGLAELPLYSGGPVDPMMLFYVNRLEDPIDQSTEIVEGLAIGGDFEQLKLRLKASPELVKDIRLFLGYSGWSPGQLQNEVDEKTWIVMNPTSDEIIFTPSDHELWKELLSKLGGKFKVMSGFPLDPNMN